MLHTSQRDRDRLVVIRQIAEGRMPVVRAAELLELSRRQVYRSVARFEVEGHRAVVHRSRGRPPNNAKGPGQDHRRHPPRRIRSLPLQQPLPRARADRSVAEARAAAQAGRQAPAPDHTSVSTAPRASSSRPRSSLAPSLALCASTNFYACCFAAGAFDPIGCGGLIINL